MATITPRKRKYSSSRDCSQIIYGNPVKKLMLEFTDERSMVKMPIGHGVSVTKQTPRFQDNVKENQHLLQRSAKSQKFDLSPLQSASVPEGIRREIQPRTSPKSGATHSSIVSSNSFYSKRKPYLNILERKLANETLPLGPRNNEGNLPIVNKTETAQVKVIPAGNTSLKVSKRSAASRQAKTVPRNARITKTKMIPPNPVKQKENVNCVIEKKMETPFRVLSMKFKPVLKLQASAAFFTTGKKRPFRSKKELSSPSSLHSGSMSIVKEKQDRHQAHTEVRLSTENKAVEVGRKQNHMFEPQKQKKQHHVEDGKLLPNMTQHSLPSHSASDMETQVSEEIVKGPPSNKNEHENAFSSKIPIETSNTSSVEDVSHPLFSTPPSSKKRLQVLPHEQPSFVEYSAVVQKVPAILKTCKKVKELQKDLKDQMVIDAGQKHFGATICKVCGMVYSAANPEDEAQHIQYHQRFLEGIKYVGWKKERVVAEFWDGKIVLIRQDDPKYAVKKVEDVRQLVDNELGFKHVTLACPTQTQTYLFVSVNKIVGCLIAEPVRLAFRVLSEPAKSPIKNSLDHHRAWYCSTKPEKVVCGISRIWVFSLMRRKGVASRLVDTVRNTFLFGCYLTANEIAFSDPTPDGKLFAAKYCQTPNFLVYNFLK